MKKYPLAALCAFFAAGIFAAGFLEYSPAFGVVCSLVTLAVLAGCFILFFRRSPRSKGWLPVLLCALFFLLGFSRYVAQQKVDSAKMEAVTWYTPVRWQGTVEEVVHRAGDRLELYVSLDRSASFRGSLILPDTMRVRVGDALSGISCLFPVPPRLGAGTFDARINYARKGVYASLKETATLQRAVSRSSGLGSVVYDLHEGMRDKLLASGLDDQTVSFTQAVITGNKNYLSPQTKKDFQMAGVAHILAVSGLHVGVIAGIVGLVFSFLFKNKTARLIAILSVLWIYAVFTGLSPSVVRAVGMASVLFLCLLTGRKYLALQAIASVALVNLVVAPRELFYIGFQLSYAAVLTIILVYRPLDQWLNRSQNRIVRYLVSLLIITVAVQLALSPLLLYAFGDFNFLFWASNILIVPLVSLLVIPLGLLVILLSTCGIPLGFLGGIYTFFVRLAEGSAGFFASADDFIVQDISPGPALLIAGLGVVVFIILWIRNNSARWMVLAGCAVVCSVLFVVEEFRPVFLVRESYGNWAFDISGSTSEPVRNDTLHLVQGHSEACISLIFRPSDMNMKPLAYLAPQDYLLVPSDFCTRSFLPENKLPSLVILTPDMPSASVRWWLLWTHEHSIPVYDMNFRGRFPLNDGKN